MTTYGSKRQSVPTRIASPAQDRTAPATTPSPQANGVRKAVVARMRATPSANQPGQRSPDGKMARMQKGNAPTTAPSAIPYMRCRIVAGRCGVTSMSTYCPANDCGSPAAAATNDPDCLRSERPPSGAAALRSDSETAQDVRDSLLPHRNVSANAGASHFLSRRSRNRPSWSTNYTVRSACTSSTWPSRISTHKFGEWSRSGVSRA